MEAKKSNTSVSEYIRRKTSDGSAERISTRGYRLGMLFGIVAGIVYDRTTDNGSEDFARAYDLISGPQPEKLGLIINQMRGDNRLKTMMSYIKPDDFVGPLSADDQSEFAIGFYHKLDTNEGHRS